MKTNFKARKPNSNLHKKARITINLNKESKNPHTRFFIPENQAWADNLIEQQNEIKPEYSFIHQLKPKNNKFIIKWWEN